MNSPHETDAKHRIRTISVHKPQSWMLPGRLIGLLRPGRRALALLALMTLFAVPSAWATVDWTVNNNDTGFDPVPAGGNIQYVVTVANNGNTPAPETTLTLTIPSTTTFVSATGLSCTGTGPVTCNVPSLNSGGSPGDSVSVTVVVRTTTQGVVTLEASVPTTGDSDPANNAANQSTTVIAGADIALSLSGPASATSGSMVAYTFTATNNGPDAAGPQTLSFPIPTGLVNVSPPAGCSLSGSTYACSIGGLAPGASASRTFTGQIAAASGSTLTASGSVVATGTPLDPIANNNTATFSTVVSPGSDLRLTKSRSPSGTLLVGQSVTFTLTPSYTGDSPSNLTITDTIPSNYTIGTVASPQNGWSCSVSGQTVTCTRPAGLGAGYNVSLGSISIPATATTAGTGVTNTATIGATSPNDPNPANNTASDGGVTIQAPTVDLRANKSGPNPTVIVTGQTHTWWISVTNLGNTAFYGTLVMTDNLPAGVTVSNYTLNGWSCSPAAPVTGPATITCTRVYTAGAPLAANATTPSVGLNFTANAAGGFTNSMTVSSPNPNQPDSNPANDTTTHGVTASTPGDAADIRVVKTANPSTVPAGEVLTYTLEVINDGPQASANITLTDDFTSLINSSVGATGAGYVDHTITANAASGINCSTSAPSGTTRRLTCTISSLPVCTADSNCPVILVQVRPGGNGGSRTNTANVISATTADPNLTNNTGNVSSTVTPRADVTVSKSATPSPVPAGQNLTYVVTARNINNGLSAAYNVIVTDTLPHGVVFISATPSAGSCTTLPSVNSPTGPGNDQVVCNLGTINNGAQQTVTIVVRPTTATRGSSLTNAVMVSTTTDETDGGNNSATVATPVGNPSLDLLVNKTESIDPIAVGDDTVYTITVTNNGPSAAEDLVVTDTLPPSRLTYQSHTEPAGGSCPTVPSVGSTGGNLVCTIPYLPAGQSRSFTVTMRGLAKGVDTNTVMSVTARETSLGFESNLANNEVTENTTVRTKADMQVVSKTPSVNPVNLRDSFNFVVKVHNNPGPGLAEADGVVVSDTLPAGMQLTGTPSVTVVSGSASSASCTGTAGATSFSCSLGTVSSGAVVDIFIPVKVISVSTAPQTLNNTASVTTTSLDINAANNSASGPVTVNSSSLAGRVFRDFNNDGAVSTDDTGISGVTMTLTGTAHDGATITRTVTTDANGNYSFGLLPAGTYTITQGTVSEAHLLDGIDTAGSAGGNTSVNDTISAINLPANTAATGYNFAEVPQARVGIAKRVTSGPSSNADGSYTVGFELVVRNYSLETLNLVTVTDTLAGPAPRFGTHYAGSLDHGQYQLVGAPSGTCDGIQPSYTGGLGADILAVIPSLAAGSSCTITLSLRVKPTIPQPPVSGTCGARYCNQASVTGYGALSGQIPNDLSDNGASPDPDNDGQPNEAGENDPTPVAPSFNAAVGIAKRLDSQVSVQPDGSLQVPIQLVVANVGNEPVNVEVSDPLASDAGGPFGSYLAGGAGASLANGQYTVQTPPVFVGSCNNGVVNSGFTGSSGGTTLASVTAMAPGASCTIRFAYRFMPETARSYVNQASASGIGGYTGTTVSDLSDEGVNPDPNGNGNAGEDGENDPTAVPIPRIGIAKQAGSVINHGDGSYSVPFTLTVQNYGQTPLSNVQVTDTLTPQFGTYTSAPIPAAGQYTIVGAPTVSGAVNGAALVPNTAFTGSGANTALLDAAASSLPNFGASASRAQIAFTVRFFPTTPGPFNNGAQARGSPPGGGTVTDTSVSGTEPDANGNGDPADDAGPTVVDLAGQAIGVAKRVEGGIVQTGTRRFRIPYALVVRNISRTVTATNVQVSDDLVSAFPTAVSRTIVAAPSVSGCTGAPLAPNPAYSGTGANGLLAGNQHLQPGEQCSIHFTVEIDFGSNPLPDMPQYNQARATTAQSPGGTVIASDFSDDGVNPDPDGDGHADEPGENDPTPVSFTAANLSAISGKVYVDANHDRHDNDPPGGSLVQGFIVEVLNAVGQVVGSAVTDASGSYSITGLFPSTPGDPATTYRLRFRDPVNGAIWGQPQSADPDPARNGSVVNGVITGLWLAPGVTTVQQNLPLDPSGVVYDAVTRTPIAGARVTLTYAGVPVPAGCLVGGINPQITGPSGAYQYLLINPVPAGCPGDGIYELQVSEPTGYLPPPSAMIPPAAGPYTPSSGGVDAIQAQNGPPPAGAPTTYYLSFRLTLGSSSQVVNNHIPIDPILEGALQVTKTTPLINVSRGDLVPYTLTLRNTTTAPLSNIALRDLMPPGFKYKTGSARLDGVAREPAVSGRQLEWGGLSFAPGQTRTLKLLLVVGSGLGEGVYTNTAWAMHSVANRQVSNTAEAAVRIVPDPTFDCSEVIGKVFDDRNANGYQDEGEPGIANVRLATARGLLVTTDAEGRFHVACADVPQALRGSNFIMKLDERTLPSGYRLTTENPREVRLTRGKMVKLNFGASIHRVVRVELSDAAFRKGTSDPGPALTQALERLPASLRERPSVLRLAYRQSGEETGLIRERLRAVRTLLERLWKDQGCCYTLQFEEEVFQGAVGNGGGTP